MKIEKKHEGKPPDFASTILLEKLSTPMITHGNREKDEEGFTLPSQTRPGGADAADATGGPK